MRSQIGLVAVVLLATTASAQPDVATIVGNMKKGLEPPRPSMRTIDLVTSAQMVGEDDKQMGRNERELRCRPAGLVLDPDHLRDTLKSPIWNPAPK